jgi:anti-anti-sigma factor
VLDVDFDGGTLHVLRERTAACWASAGMPEGRAAEFTLAVHELAANAVRHGPGSGRLVVDEVPGGLRCQVSNTGPGPRLWPRRPGHGLWIADQVADHVAVSSSRDGFRVTAVFDRQQAGPAPVREDRGRPDSARTTPPGRVPGAGPGDLVTGVSELSVSVSAGEGEAGPRTLVRLVGEADASTPALGEILRAEAAKHPRMLLIDASGLTFIDSSALHEVVRVHLQLREAGCQLVIIRPGPAVARVLRLTALDQVIPVRSGADEGTACAGNPGPAGRVPVSGEEAEP